MKEFIRRKNLLFTTCVCWCPTVFECHRCLRNPMPGNVYYTSYFQNYTLCTHAVTMMATLNKAGYMFVWLFTYCRSNHKESSVKLLTKIDTGTPWPISVAWHQEGDRG